MKRTIISVIVIFLFASANLTAQVYGVLYGTTTTGSPNRGTLYSFDYRAKQEKTVIDFAASSGSGAHGDLVYLSNGLLYGLTTADGAYGVGTIFSYNPVSGDSVILYSFSNAQGSTPYGGLMQASNGLLYGMTSIGGSGNGVLFSFDTGSKSYNAVFSFTGTGGANAGTSPFGSLLQANNGLLYGMTYQGGSNNAGVLFSYDIGSGTDSILVNFDGKGSNPSGNLIQAYNGLLYGMTRSSSGGNGVIFSFNPGSKQEKIEYGLSGEAEGSLLQGTDSLLYGETSNDGLYSAGTMFSFNPKTGKYITLINFNGTQGQHPCRELVEASDTCIYGTTLVGGNNNGGVIFRYNMVTKLSDTVYNFSSSSGINPYGGLIELKYVSIAKTDNKCYGDSKGTAKANARIGKSPFSYAWSTGATTDSISGLAAGTYTVGVTDGQGQMYSLSFVIKQPAQLVDTIGQQVNVSCYGGSNGSITMGVKGGVTPYNYTWASSSNTNLKDSGLVAGSYTFSTTDANSCVTPLTITITEPKVLKDSTVSKNNINCYGASTGNAVVGVRGGATPYVYNWSGGAGTNAAISSVMAGTYTCMVTDNNLCVTSDTVIITQPPSKISVVTSYTPTPCNKSTGAVNVAVSGGIPPYTYAWSPSGGTNSLDTALPSKLYTCTIIDSINCASIANIYLSNIGGPKDTIVASTNETCYGQSIGTATATVTGGTAPFTYSWSPSGGSDTAASGLLAGTYTFTTIDKKGCSGITIVNISQPSQLRDSIVSSVNLICYGNNIGSASIGITGGVTPYTYSWSGGAGTLAAA
ncbi:MAG TPA: choice-of-anchor tandem repeat GloVer-containing protein, partial [Bacteroidia bacterium]|nr:choice-of-anchor tandem repeat GloVer-containing protein [Bacteroidia bacterium]